MQYVNDDTDDIFRRAGKDYPLKTSGADWNKIAKTLNPIISEEEPRKPNRRRYLFLLLLLPLPWLCYHHLSDRNDEENTSAKTEQLAAIEQLKKETVLNNEVIATENKSLINSNKKFDGELAVLPQNHDTKRRNQIGKQSASGRTKSSNSFNEIINNDASVENSSVFERHLLTDYQLPKSTETILSPLQVSGSVHTSKRIETSAEPSQKEHSKRFYAGLVGGIAATTIRFQKINQAGSDLGLIAGYELSKHWSIEAAILSVKKYYYTDGTQFNTAKMRIPPNTRITSVDGDCSMLEVPVSVRYNFPTSRKLKWFATAGLSNLFMKKEAYDYVYLYAASGRSVVYSKEYRLSSDHWLSTAQFSGGVEYPIKNIAHLRIEPYVQLPLKGVGFGQVALTTAGLRIGITKKLY